MRPLGPIVAAALLVSSALGCGLDDDPCANPLGPQCPPITARQPCGVAFTPPTVAGAATAYGTPTSDAALKAAAALGVRALALSPFATMASTTSTVVKSIYVDDAAFKSLASDAARARTLGMRIFVKPHVLLDDSKWIGDAAPSTTAGGWKAWFASYGAFMTKVARFASSVSAEWMCVGLENKASSKTEAALWRALIANVRKTYAGKLTYCANWDEAADVPFWADLDGVAVQMFAPLRGGPLNGLTDEGEPASYAVMLGRAHQHLGTYSALATRVGKPLLVSEVGYTNREGAAMQPWVWPEDALSRKRSEAGDLEQALAYRVVLEAFGSSARVTGLYWWQWFTDGAFDSASGVSFTPRGKLAERVLSSACGGAAKK